MDPKEIYHRTNVLAKACMKVSMLLPVDQPMATFARVELVRHASELGVKTRGLRKGQLSSVFIERLSKAVDSCNGCGFWLQTVLDDGLLQKKEILEPLIQECDALSYLFLAALKRANDQTE